MNTRIDTAIIQGDVNGSTRVLGHPDDVVRNPGMSIEEKRAVLAAWASDAHAVENAPALRQLDDGSVVPVDDILRALNSLERTVDFAECADPAPRRRGTLLSRIRNIRLHRDDDDDPPPCPGAAVPVQWRRTEALAAAA